MYEFLAAIPMINLVAAVLSVASLAGLRLRQEQPWRAAQIMVAGGLIAGLGAALEVFGLAAPMFIASVTDIPPHSWRLPTLLFLSFVHAGLARWLFRKGAHVAQIQGLRANLGRGRSVRMPIGDVTWSSICWETGEPGGELRPVRLARYIVLGVYNSSIILDMNVPLTQEPRSYTVQQKMPLILLVLVAVYLVSLGFMPRGPTAGSAWFNANLALWFALWIWSCWSPAYRFLWLDPLRNIVTVRFNDADRAHRIRADLREHLEAAGPVETA